MPLKVLLADDSLTAQNMGKKILTDAGFDVVAVSNGAQALKKIQSEKPDLALLDVYMPGYSGLEVCEIMRKSPLTARMPVVLCVGKMEPFSHDDGRRVKADGVIVKPFEATDLVALVKRLADSLPAPPAPPKDKDKDKDKDGNPFGYKGVLWKPSPEEQAAAIEQPAAARMEVPEEIASEPAMGMDVMNEPWEVNAPPQQPQPVAAPATENAPLEFEIERDEVAQGPVAPDASMVLADGCSAVFEYRPPGTAAASGAGMSAVSPDPLMVSTSVVTEPLPAASDILPDPLLAGREATRAAVTAEDETAPEPMLMSPQAIQLEAAALELHAAQSSEAMPQLAEMEPLSGPEVAVALAEPQAAWEPALPVWSAQEVPLEEDEESTFLEEEMLLAAAPPQPQSAAPAAEIMPEMIERAVERVLERMKPQLIADVARELLAELEKK